MAKRKVGLPVTSEVIAAATEAYLAKGGTITRSKIDRKDERHIDWITYDYVGKIRDDKKLTVDDAKLDTTDYSSSDI